MLRQARRSGVEQGGGQEGMKMRRRFRSDWHCRVLRTLAAAGLLVFATSSASPAEEHPATGPLPTLTRAAQIRELPPNRAKLDFPVRLQGVVTYFDHPRGDLFFQDSSGGIWVDSANGQVPAGLTAGDRVEVEGVSAFTDFAPEISLKKIRILGRGALPRARRVAYSDLKSGREDSQWVAFEGVVRWAEEQGGLFTIGIAQGENRLRAQFLDRRGLETNSMVDARVKVEGACASVFNARGQLLDVFLHVPSAAQLHIQEPAPAKPYAVPWQPILSVLQFKTRGTFEHRVRIEGVVTLAHPGSALYVNDGTDSAYVETKQPGPIEVGERVEVLGFPATGVYSPTLQDAVFRKVGRGAIPAPIPITSDQALSGHFDAQLIQISGRLIDLSHQEDDEVLAVVDGTRVFNARLGFAQGGSSLAALARGRQVRLIGICSVRADANGTPIAFRIWLRSPSDLVVLERPSWFTLRHALLALAMMALLIVVALYWVGALRRKVEEQTGVLALRLERISALEERYRELFENASDMLFTCGLRGAIVALNQAGERMTGYSCQEVIGKGIRSLIALEYSRLIAEVFESSEEGKGCVTNLQVELLTKDGRRVPVEISTNFMMAHQAVVGIQGIARDITERKRAERLRDAAYRIAHAAGSAESIEAFFRSAHKIVGELMPADNFYIALYDSPSGILSFSYYVDVKDPAPPPRKLRKGFTEYVLRMGQPLLAHPEVLQELVRRGEIEPRGTNPTDRVAVPLRANDRACGVLVVQSYAEGVWYGEDEKNALVFVSDQVALAIARKQAEEERRLLHMITQAIETSEDFPSALRAALQKICEQTGWPFGEAWVPRSDGSCLECSPACYGLVPKLAPFRSASETLTFRSGQGFPGRTWSLAQRAYWAELSLDRDFIRAEAARLVGFRIGMAIPVLVGQEVVAIMGFFVFEARPQDQGWFQIVSSVASQLGTVLLRKRADEELRRAKVPAAPRPNSWRT
ncbi:MAG: hypothetical protein DMG21_08765 [Acidobacteria bacterium]|nr:MAG: hypothetical protein DMG21_08765 [Acidobacteriota bacterium]